MLSLSQFEEVLNDLTGEVRNNSDYASILIKMGNALRRPNTSNFDTAAIARANELLRQIEQKLIKKNPEEQEAIEKTFDSFMKLVLKIEESRRTPESLSYIDYAIDLGRDLKNFAHTVKLLKGTSLALIFIPIFSN